MNNELRKSVGNIVGLVVWLFVGLLVADYVSPGAAVFVGLLAGWGVAVLLYPKSQDQRGNG
jgi:hypothetical protein